MKQEAIIFTRDNADTIAARLIEYTAEELIDEYKWMLKDNPALVLARDVLDDGVGVLSYVVTRDMFERNNPGIQLTAGHFTHVRDV